MGATRVQRGRNILLVLGAKNDSDRERPGKRLFGGGFQGHVFPVSSLMGFFAPLDKLSPIFWAVNFSIIISHSECPLPIRVSDYGVVLMPVHRNARCRCSALLNKTWLGKSVGTSDQNVRALNSNLAIPTTTRAEETEELAIWNTHPAVVKNGSDFDLMLAAWTVHVVANGQHQRPGAKGRTA